MTEYMILVEEINTHNNNLMKMYDIYSDIMSTKNLNTDKLFFNQVTKYLHELNEFNIHPKFTFCSYIETRGRKPVKITNEQIKVKANKLGINYCDEDFEQCKMARGLTLLTQKKINKIQEKLLDIVNRQVNESDAESDFEEEEL
jgi:hypothetical protein